MLKLMYAAVIRAAERDTLGEQGLDRKHVVLLTIGVGEVLRLAKSLATS